MTEYRSGPDTDPMKFMSAACEEIYDIRFEGQMIVALKNILGGYLNKTKMCPKWFISDVEKAISSCEQIEEEYYTRETELELQVKAIKNKLAEIVPDPGSNSDTLGHWAELLNGTEYPLSISAEYEERMKAEGIVIFYGESDKLLEARGAMNDEWGAWGGKTLYFENGIVYAAWTDSFKKSWIIFSNVPCQQFKIRENGIIQCTGIVLFKKDLGRLKEVEE